MSGYQDQPAVYPGFAMFQMRCALCGYEWVGVAAVGTVGAECPKCHVNDRDFVWLGPKPWLPHDGCWIRGYSRLPWWPHPSTTPGETAARLRSGCSDSPETSAAPDSEIDAYTGEPKSFVRRWLSRLQNAWWALKGEW